MLASLFWTVAGLVLAGGGVWVAALFVPSLAIVLKAAVDFIRSPIGQVSAAILALFVFFAFGYAEGDVHGTNSTRTAWRAANAMAEAAAKRRDADIKAKIAAEVNASLARLESDEKSLDQKVADNEKANVGRPECRATGDDIRRLFSIR